MQKHNKLHMCVHCNEINGGFIMEDDLTVRCNKCGGYNTIISQETVVDIVNQYNKEHGYTVYFGEKLE